MTQGVHARVSRNWLSALTAWRHWPHCFCALATIFAVLIVPTLVLARLVAVSSR